MKLLSYVIGDPSKLGHRSLSIDEIVRLMQPTDIKNLQIPTEFATSMKEILDEEPNCNDVESSQPVNTK